MFDWNGKNVKLWVNEREGRNGKWNSYSVSVSKKVEDKYINKEVKVLFGRDVWIPDTIRNGEVIEELEGFPTLDIYTDKNGNERREIMLYITKCKWKDLTDDDSFTAMEEEIPF